MRFRGTFAVYFFVRGQLEGSRLCSLGRLVARSLGWPLLKTGHSRSHPPSNRGTSRFDDPGSLIAAESGSRDEARGADAGPENWGSPVTVF